MSLSKSHALLEVAKVVCRDLRKRSTSAERIFWERVRDRRFQALKFYRQHPLFVDIDGRETFYVADFYCHEYKLVVEIDGKVHDYTVHHDELRTKAINDLGIEVVRFKNELIESNINVVMETLIELIFKNTGSLRP